MSSWVPFFWDEGSPNPLFLCPLEAYNFTSFEWAQNPNLSFSHSLTTWDTGVSRLTVDQGINLHLFGWFVMVDLSNEPHRVALIAQDGREKPAFDVWKDL